MKQLRCSMSKNVLLTLLQISPLVLAFPRPQDSGQLTSADLPVTQTPTSISGTQTVPDTRGTVRTSLETGGRTSIQPFPTSIIPSAPATIRTTGTFASLPNVTVTQTRLCLSRVLEPGEASAQSDCGGTTLITQTATISSSISLSTATLTVGEAPQDAFLPVATGAIPANIPSRGDHPVPRLGIQDQSQPISTNKFYANFFLGDQNLGTWTHPYSVSWSKGNGNAQSWGLSVSHVDANQRVFGPPNGAIPGNPDTYFISPSGIQSIILSAAELGGSSVLTTDTLEAFSVNVNLQPQPGSAGRITFPLVQGMGFVTARYTGLQPALHSSVFYRAVIAAGSPKAGVYKYRVTLEDGKSWLVYAMPSNGVDPNLQLASNTLLRGPADFSGTIQVAKNPSGSSGEQMFDNSAGVYATSAHVSGSVSGATGTYSLTWSKSGAQAGNSSLVMFALPHHVESFDATTASHKMVVQLNTTTKGVATAVVADAWTMVESSLPVDIDFAPWSPTTRSVPNLSAAAMAAIANVSASEVSQDMNAQTNLDSLYFSGKALSKFATIVYTINDLQRNPTLAAAGLAKLKTAFSRWVGQQQVYPLVYDTTWKGVVSSGTYKTGSAGLDFGNTYYNDHHFHFAYFIHTAAIIGYLDPSWLAANKDWVNMLVRDVSNPSTDDALFPFSRSFDWFHGHSWAKGLFESGDGKDEESSSEDAMFAYALKMWGRTIGDQSMEARGNLMLSILTRSLQNYFLLDSSNTNQPSSFIENKVTGILFDNKIDHATYFGTNLEYIQGIHMIPLNPSSALTRTKQFVQEEWNTYFADGAADPASNVAGGWRGILYANLAIVDPRTSWDFFAQPNFDNSWLDGGASRTWYLAYAAGLGGAPS